MINLVVLYPENIREKDTVKGRAMDYCTIGIQEKGIQSKEEPWINNGVMGVQTKPAK